MKSIVKAKKKTNRSLHANLWGDPKSPYLKREYGPGQHGARKRQLSDYGQQLQAKQRLKTYYGNVSEKQFHKYYVEATRRRGDAAENLIGILESRLDNLVFKSKFVPSIFAARQFVNHGHILVNGKRVNIPSYMVKAGDIISVKEKSQQMPMVVASLESNLHEIPSYLEADSKYSVKYAFVPKFDDVPYASVMEPNLVIEFYSR